MFHNRRHFQQFSKVESQSGLFHCSIINNNVVPSLFSSEILPLDLEHNFSNTTEPDFHCCNA